MNKLVTAEQMREIERNTFDLGVAPIAVMETAASAVSGYILKRFGVCRVCAVCGRGNNGGDGFAAARQLSAAGCDVTVIAAFGEPKTDNARTNYEILKKMNVRFAGVIPENTDVIIDALFGIGISGGADAGIIDRINESRAFKIAVDAPSGANTDTGEVGGKAVRADVTITFGYKKTGLTQYPAKSFCGEVITVPMTFIDRRGGDTFEVTSPPQLPKTAQDAHKGSNGRLLIIAGSAGMTGAAYLACTAALRCGCGLVTLAIPENLNPIMEVKLTEAMTIPLKCRDRITYDAFSLLDLSKYDGAVIGPGLGTSGEVCEIIEHLASKNMPLVIDADGINSIKSNIDIINGKNNIILTPHPGEFARLLEKDIGEVQKNRTELARGFAKRHGVTLVLKGAGTVTAEPDGRCYINTTGNGGMAKGGSGDVLAGMAGAFAVKNVPHAAAAAVYYHGLAGDKALKRRCAESMLPTDITAAITEALRENE